MSSTAPTPVPRGYDPAWWARHVERMRRLGTRARLSDPTARWRAYNELAVRAVHASLPPGWKPPARDDRTEARVAALAREVGRNARRRRKAAFAPTAARPRDGVYQLDPREVERTLDELVASAVARGVRRRELRRQEIGAAVLAHFGTRRHGRS